MTDNKRRFPSQLKQSEQISRQFTESINHGQPEKTAKPLQFDDQELQAFEMSLKERALKVRDRRWAVDQQTKPFASIDLIREAQKKKQKQARNQLLAPQLCNVHSPGLVAPLNSSAT